MTSLRAAILEYVRQNARPVDKFSHQPRVYHLATQVGSGLAYDDDVLHAAAWLHDIGVFEGHRPEDPVALGRWDSLAYAVAKVPGILAALRFPAEKIPPVVEAIRGHLPASKPTTTEGVILRDADMLEQLGAVGILRNVSKVGRDTRFPRFRDILPVLRRNLDTLPGQLQIPRARELAEPRIATLRAFLIAADLELDATETAETQ